MVTESIYISQKIKKPRLDVSVYDVEEAAQIAMSVLISEMSKSKYDLAYHKSIIENGMDFSQFILNSFTFPPYCWKVKRFNAPVSFEKSHFIICQNYIKKYYKATLFYIMFSEEKKAQYLLVPLTFIQYLISLNLFQLPNSSIENS